MHGAFALGFELLPLRPLSLQATERPTPCISPLSGWFERKDALPVVLHADHGPAFLLRFVVKRLGEGADLAGGKPLCRPVGVFAFRIVMHHQHHQPRTIAGPGVFKHLPVAIRIAERRVWPPADHQVNAFGLAGLVVVQE